MAGLVFLSFFLFCFGFFFKCAALLFFSFLLEQISRLFFFKTRKEKGNKRKREEKRERELEQVGRLFPWESTR
jgi:Na+-driven multidrug efflux pump